MFGQGTITQSRRFPQVASFSPEHLSCLHGIGVPNFAALQINASDRFNPYLVVDETSAPKSGSVREQNTDPTLYFI